MAQTSLVNGLPDMSARVTPPTATATAPAAAKDCLSPLRPITAMDNAMAPATVFMPTLPIIVTDTAPGLATG